MGIGESDKRLETKMRSDPERTGIGGCWESDRQRWGPRCSPRRGGDQKPVSWHRVWGEASARELGEVGDAFHVIASYGFFLFCFWVFFAYFRCLHLLLAMAGEEAAFRPFPADGILGQSHYPLLRKAGAGRGAAQGGPHLSPYPRLSIPGCCAWKEATNHRSLTGCLSFSVSVFFTFFDLWTMKCFPKEWVPFEMHILKVLYSINGLVFLNHLSQTP